MKRHNLQEKLHGIWNRRHLALLTLTAVFLTAAVTTSHASALYILTDADDTAIVLDSAAKLPDLSSQIVNVTTGGKGYDVTLAAKQTVTVHRNGETQTVQSRNESVSRLLERIGIVPSPLETVAVDLSGSGVEITVEEEIIYYDRVVEEVTFDTVRIANPEMKKGTEKVVQEGADGVRTSIYEVVFSNGRELSRQFVEELDSTAVDQIVEYGTAEEQTASSVMSNNKSAISNVSKNGDGSGTLTLADGTTLNFSAAKSMTATAYTAGHGGVDYCTATGTTVRVGTVAVDKSVIPLGTKLFIVTTDGLVYGTAVAEDTGVRGNKVDLYFDTYQQCISFGRRSCTVYILE
ncbi:G5 and 3D domain-containing protein [Oscillibacter valericigenes]|uniref:G5 and 3D domain-containing protein n=1 Tax=Oscillibacter valericigenes TaxID=351091 RepID=UPI001F1AF3F3|nr:G5 domain-containing protein [Oscillibacter valericigenes]